MTTKTRKLNAAVIGCYGGWGRLVLPQYVKLRNQGFLDKVYGCDRSPAEAQHPLHSYTYVSSYRDIADADMVHIATPNSAHFEVASHFMSKGINVLVEKPITEDVPSAEGLLKLAKDKDVIFKTGLIYRFNNILNGLKEVIDSGELGRVYYVRLNWEFKRPPMENTSVIMDLMPHMIDISKFLLGNEELRYVNGTSYVLRRSSNAELANINLVSAKSEIPFEYNINWFYGYKRRTVEVMGERACVIADLLQQKMVVYVDGNPVREIGAEKNDPLYDEAKNFYSDVTEGKNIRNPATLGLDGVKMINQIMKRIEEKRCPRLRS